MAQTIFERYGGFSFVRKIVSAFYDRVIDSPDLQGYFANVEMPRLIDHQTKFVAQMMQGPASFTDEQLRRVHQPLAIGPAEFQEITELLCETLEDFDFDPADIDFVRAQVLRREPFIVSRHG
ncbi:truncated hemoglobin [Ferruginivarius sediminum]|uniref:Group 1 truncated hemoglobin n=1 Tax=Ferruginivarius sediminum TaxID=2661937 RepID=A0A369T8J7_9PROT|nr:group 1 truncated hemoglobin [Ferruginivarius sediminum]RDD60675.1 group 1 truncated hemoglobin [Ferruginivarius sediminum]